MLIKLPFYFKAVIILIGLVLLFYILSQAWHIIVIFSLSAMLSILLLPLNNFLEGIKFPRIAAIIICLIVVTAIIGLLGFFIYSQLVRFVEDLNLVTERLTQLVHESADFFESHFGIEKSKHEQWVRESVEGSLKKGSSVFVAALSLTTTAVSILGLLPVFTFFLLYYRNFYREFALMIFNFKRHEKVLFVIDKIESVVQSYLVGVLIVTSIISAMNVTGLTILGVRYAFFFGVLAGILNIIPYIGVFIGSSLPIVYTYLVEGSALKAGGVMILMWAIQFTEGHFITPNIVGSKVSLNPFAAILALIIGGQLWGPVGMILFIPYTAVLKVICDNMEDLQPYGFLLGNPEQEKKKKKSIQKEDKGTSSPL
jgi:predicted PurR-regulated permease PerM